MEVERETVELALDDLDPGGGAASLRDAPADEEQAEGLATEESYSELRSIWQREHVSDDAPAAKRLASAAFERACQQVAPADILDAARSWVAAADAPRYLPPLALWLDARGWERPPPQKARRSTPRRNLPRSNARKVDLFKVAMMQGGYVEDASGRMVWGGLQ
jgi:hypothetical protein